MAPLIPTQFANYYEPFLGSGTVYFRYCADAPAYLSDTIEPLIDCYRGVASDPHSVGEIARSWPVDSDTFYRIRETIFEAGTNESAARFIYLNRFCFNGLYRENARGKFNVPFGRPKNTSMTDTYTLELCSSRLRSNTSLECQDFEQALAQCSDRDFAYLDPPYLAGHRTNGFVDYNSRIFSTDDQERLASVFRELNSRGAYVILTNADHASIRRQYSGLQIVPVTRYSSMAGKNQFRGPSTELMILSDRVKIESGLQ